MNTTPEQLRLAADILQRKEPFQYRHLRDTWSDCKDPNAIVDLLHSGCEIRPKPLAWPPKPEGMEWHREDWTEEMLPEGWRPLLNGEPVVGGDERQTPSKVGFYPVADGCYTDHISKCFYRTRRPLPEPPKLIPLGPEDVPPGSVFKWGTCGPYALLTMTCDFVYFADSTLFQRTWEWLMKHAQIHRPGNLDGNGKPVFEPCSKEGTSS